MNAGYTAVSWWASNLARKMAKGSTSAEFWYGPDRARVLQLATRAAESERTVYLGSLYERTVITPSSGNATTRHVHYVRAGDETVAIKTWSKIGTGAYSPSVRYLHRDHLGSVVAITTETGTVESRSSFDVWGKRRDPATWVTPAPGTFTAAPTATDRGYTGHEHVDELGLVHMNGRIYDPEIGKFLSADPTLQFPESTQGYNRYAYAGNNPLTFTDPSGFSFWKGLMKVVGWIGFIVSLVMPITTIWWQAILQSAWQGFLMSGGNLKAGLLAGLSAGLGMGLGKISFIARAGLLGKLAAGGLVSSAMGGSFGKGVVGSLVGMVRNSAISGMLETSGIAESIRDALDAGTTDTPNAISSENAARQQCGKEPPENKGASTTTLWKYQNNVTAWEKDGIRHVLLRGDVDWVESTIHGINRDYIEGFVAGVNSSLSFDGFFEDKRYVIQADLRIGKAIQGGGANRVGSMFSVRFEASPVIAGDAYWEVSTTSVRIVNPIKFSQYGFYGAGHEVGHGLGLGHFQNSTHGLMSYCGRTLRPFEAGLIWKKSTSN